jgi:hypothetical protein
MSSNYPEEVRVGLCFSCRHMCQVRTDRGSVFYQCQRAATEPEYPKYPRLPVFHCPGYEVKKGLPESPA